MDCEDCSSFVCAHKELTKGSTGNCGTTFSWGPTRDPNPRIK